MLAVKTTSCIGDTVYWMMMMMMMNKFVSMRESKSSSVWSTHARAYLFILFIYSLHITMVDCNLHCIYTNMKPYNSLKLKTIYGQKSLNLW